MAADLCGGSVNGGVVGFQALKCFLFECASEERTLQRIQLARHVVVLVKVRVVKYLSKNLFAQDVLNQHLAHVGTPTHCASVERASAMPVRAKMSMGSVASQTASMRINAATRAARLRKRRCPAAATSRRWWCWRG